MNDDKASESEIAAAAERLISSNGESGFFKQYGDGNHDFGDDVNDVAKWALARLAADRAECRPLPNAVKQTTPTNCFRACVATVLGLPIDEVPTACDGPTWDWGEFQRWLASRGLQAIEIGFANGGTIYPVSTPVPCIVSGSSPRECRTGRHAVVGELIGIDGFRLLHDPHPSDLWIDGEPTHATFFVSTTLATDMADRIADRAERDKRARPIDEAFLRSRGFLPDGTCDGREFGFRIWGADEDVSYGEHAAFQVKVSMIDHSSWLECYDTAGDTVGLTELPIARTQGAIDDLLRVLKGGAE